VGEYLAERRKEGRRRVMGNVSLWRDSGHLEQAVETAGGRQAFEAAVAAMLDDARGWRSAEMRKHHGTSSSLSGAMSEWRDGRVRSR
jgi:hypothetical protein